MKFNKCMIDWFTATSFHNSMWGEVDRRMRMLRERGDMQFKESRWMQYKGTKGTCEAGTIFLGIGRQRGMEHFALWCSNEYSHTVALEMLAAERVGRVKHMRVTRIDLQATLEYRNQEGVLDAISDLGMLLKKKNRDGHIRQSIHNHIKSDNMNTVTIGHRGGPAHTRIYTKDIVDDNLSYLRFETEFTKTKAQAVADRLRVSSSLAIKGILSGEMTVLECARGDRVHALFSSFFGSKGGRVKARKRTPKKIEWVRKTVAPALENMVDMGGDYRYEVERLIVALSNRIVEKKENER